MNVLLTNIASKIMFAFSLLGADAATDPRVDWAGTRYAWIGDVIYAINLIAYPFMMLVGSIGLIYSVVLGFQFVKADSSEKRDEAKKRLISAIIGVVIVIAILLLLRLFFQTQYLMPLLGYQNVDGVWTKI